MLKVAIIIGSTRPNRKGEAVAKWVYGNARKRSDASFDLVDIAAFDLPLLDEPAPPGAGKYERPHTKRWAEKISTYDAFVFVTPEYNHGTSAALKNALDFIYREWNDKAAGFVSYGSAGGARAVEHLRLVLAELQIATVRQQVMLYTGRDWREYTTFLPDPKHEKTLSKLLDQVVAWGGALRKLRDAAVARS